MPDGLVGNLLDGLLGGTSQSGLLGSNGLTGAVGDLVCSLLGPNFLRVYLGSVQCQNGVLLSSSFDSTEEFCAYYLCASEEEKECLTTGAAAVTAQLSGLLDLNLVLGDCCDYLIPCAFFITLIINLVFRRIIGHS